jgi:hypothetical protein
MLRVFNRSFTLGAIYNVVNAILCIFPIISVRSRNGFTGVILVIIARAICTGDPVTELIIIFIGSTTLAFVPVVGG